MKTNIKLLSILLLAATACGDNKLEPDARTHDSGSGSGSGFPAAPALGTQLDRMGRPAINTLLNHGFDPTAAAGSAKDQYNADTNFGSAWQAKWAPVFAKTIGVLDALDTGICGNLKCESGEISGPGNIAPVCQNDCGSAVGTTGTGNACGNTVLYNFGTPAAGTAVPNAGSYVAMGALLADDELFLNTSKPVCTLYLAVEFYASQPNMEGNETVCGGRALDYDVVDFSLSMISAGAGGFNLANFDPRIKDGANKHDDYLADFPYLGPPHAP